MAHILHGRRWPLMIPIVGLAIGIIWLIFEPLWGTIKLFMPLIAVGVAIGLAFWTPVKSRLETLGLARFVRGAVIFVGLVAFYLYIGYFGWKYLPNLAAFMGTSLLAAGVIAVGIGLILFPVPSIVIGLFRATGIPLDPTEIGRWSRLAGVVVFIVLLIRGFNVEGWFPRVKEAWAEWRVSEAAYPEPVTPVFASAPCQDPYTTPIPDSLAVRDSVFWQGEGVYQLFFTGGQVHNLLSGYNWPEDVREVQLSVSPVRNNQHLDRTGYWDPATGEHLTAPISKRRNYTPGHPESAGYCPGQLDSYPFSQTVRYYLGPNQTAVVVDPTNPRRGVYPFSDGPVRARIRRGENPVLLFNNGIPTANRLHRVEFLVTIQPI